MFAKKSAVTYLLRLIFYRNSKVLASLIFVHGNRAMHNVLNKEYSPGNSTKAYEGNLGLACNSEKSSNTCKFAGYNIQVLCKMLRYWQMVLRAECHSPTTARNWDVSRIVRVAAALLH